MTKGPESNAAERCGICGGPNQCALSLAEEQRPAECWCVREQFSPEVLRRGDPSRCICRACAMTAPLPEGDAPVVS